VLGEDSIWGRLTFLERVCVYMKRRGTIDLGNIQQCCLVECDSKVSKSHSAQRENVNYLWRVGLVEGVRHCAGGGEEDTPSVLSQSALSRIEPTGGSVHEDHVLFCKRCAILFLPGDNCTVRVISNSRKKRRKRKCAEKGVVYTCKSCGHHQRKESTARQKREPSSDKPGKKRRR
jgi:hypothetical protein